MVSLNLLENFFDFVFLEEKKVIILQYEYGSKVKRFSSICLYVYFVYKNKKIQLLKPVVSKKINKVDK